MTKKKAQFPMLTGSQGESLPIRDAVRPGFYESVAEILRTARRLAQERDHHHQEHSDRTLEKEQPFL